MAQLIQSLDVPILVAKGKLKRHDPPIVKRIEGLDEKGYVSIRELDDLGMEFVLRHRKEYRAVGNSFLEMIYMSKSNNATIIVDVDEKMIRNVAKLFEINVCTLNEFNLATVNNTEYFEFINEMKKERNRMNQ